MKMLREEVDDGRKWGGRDTEEGNSSSNLAGVRTKARLLQYPDRLTLRDTRGKRKHSRLQHQIETVNFVLSLSLVRSCFLLSGFLFQG
jgi:hypothetical protein